MNTIGTMISASLVILLHYMRNRYYIEKMGKKKALLAGNQSAYIGSIYKKEVFVLVMKVYSFCLNTLLTIY